MRLETALTLELDAKSLDDAGHFEGYATRFGTVDNDRDIIMPAAFQKSLKVRPPARVKMLRQHDQARVIGVWTDMAEDSTGLHVKGRLLMDIQDGRETATLMKAGAIDGLSIGFRTPARRDLKSGLRNIHEVDLWEISLVSFPAHPDARVTFVKSQDAGAIAAGLDRLMAVLRT